MQVRKIIFPLCLALLSLVFLAPFFYALGFCWPRGDDYDSITRAMFIFDLPGALYEVLREWLSWSGRYTYHFLAVFLGKAAAHPASCGLVCGFVILLYGISFFKLGKPCLDGCWESISFALLALSVLLACHGKLQDFYLFTDSLTIVLQAALYLLFLLQLLGLFNENTLKERQRRQKACVFWGIAAIGVYEHAALAIFWTVCAALLCASPPSFWKKLPERRKVVRQSLAAIIPWLAGAFLFAFLAPGNIQRKKARNVDMEQSWEQLTNLPADWLNFLDNFLHSRWPLCILCLSLLLRLRISSKKIPPFPGGPLCLLFLAAFLFFSLSVTGLHALSDVPLGAEGKLGASLEFYAALTLGFLIFFLPIKIRFRPLLQARFRALVCLILFIILLGSGNFHLCAENASNGQMLLYANFMCARNAWLAERAAASSSPQDKFGLLGEFEHPNVRRREVRPERGEAIVQAYPRNIFPVHMGIGLAEEPGGWPNLWAAWVYGLGALAEQAPPRERALQAVREGKGLALHVPEALRTSGLSAIWLVLDAEDPNPTFHNVWLVFSSTGSGELKILLPARPAWGRLMPYALQRKFYERFSTRKELGIDGFSRLFALTLEARMTGKGALDALWLGPSPLFPYSPHNLFASNDGLVYHKITQSKSLKPGATR